MTNNKPTDRQLVVWIDDANSVLNDGGATVDETSAASTILALCEALQERRKADSEPVAYRKFVKDDCNSLLDGYEYFDSQGKSGSREPLYAAPQSAPVVPGDRASTHSSIIAEQLSHVLSGMTVSDHQKAIISCAVDKLNKNADTICQLSKDACVLPDSLDYQGAKELFNYLMTEEETNATVNGWNACRSAMLNHQSSNQTSDSKVSGDEIKQLASNSFTDEDLEGMIHGNNPQSNAYRELLVSRRNSPVTPDCWCRTCRPVTMNDMRFVVCPDCGNKRCPHANDHRNACTGSNEPGQIGSAYPAAPQQEVN